MQASIIKTRIIVLDASIIIITHSLVLARGVSCPIAKIVVVDG